MRATAEEKRALVARYQAGESVAEICAETGVARSTFYTWLKPYQTVQTKSGYTISPAEFIKMRQRLLKLEQEIEILQKVNYNVSSPLQDKLKELEKLHGQYSVHSLCDALQVSRGTFYNHIFRRKDVTVYDKCRAEMKAHIQTAFDDSSQRFGANKICAVLSEQGICTSPQYVADLMREMGLKSITTTSKKDYNKKISIAKRQNVLQRQFHVTEPNRVWVSDITCFKLGDKYIYLCVIIDLYSRKAVGYGTSFTNSTYLVTSTFKKAFQNRGKPKQLIFHSDQGVQYTSQTFQKLLRINKVVQSFSKAGRPHDNAVAESFFSIIKREEIYRTEYRSERHFKENIDRYIIFYNSQRPYSTLGYRTPDKMESQYFEKKTG